MDFPAKWQEYLEQELYKPLGCSDEEFDFIKEIASTLYAQYIGKDVYKVRCDGGNSDAKNFRILREELQQLRTLHFMVNKNEWRILTPDQFQEARLYKELIWLQKQNVTRCMVELAPLDEIYKFL